MKIDFDKWQDEDEENEAEELRLHKEDFGDVVRLLAKLKYETFQCRKSF